MPWLIDTNIWIQYLKGRNAALGTRIDRTDEADLRICSVVKGELLHGALGYPRASDRTDRVRETLDPYDSLPSDDAAAGHYARIRHALEQQGQVIGANDFLIAAICLANDCTLVTSNTNEFSRVPGLKYEDWSQP
jgi:tRNA(fMet)-specific endonuclease VapC